MFEYLLSEGGKSGGYRIFGRRYPLWEYPQETLPVDAPCWNTSGRNTPVATGRGKEGGVGLQHIIIAAFNYPRRICANFCNV